MKKLYCLLFFALPVLTCMGQSANLGDTKAMLQGLWLSRGDSTIELEIKQDSLTTFRFRANGVSRCSYTLQNQPCVKLLKFPAATGIYMQEHYAGKDICCAFSMLSATTIKIIYPDGTEITYVNEKMLQKAQ